MTNTGSIGKKQTFIERGQFVDISNPKNPKRYTQSASPAQCCNMNNNNNCIDTIDESKRRGTTLHEGDPLLVGARQNTDGNGTSDSSEEFSESSGFSLKLILVAIIISMSSLSYGINISLMNIPEPLFKTCDPSGLGGGITRFFLLLKLPNCVKTSDFDWSLIVSIFCIGGLVGAMITGGICSKIGRKYTLLWNNLVFLSGYLLISLAVNVYMLAFGRFVLGMASGASTIAVPMYLGEISPSSVRGSIGTLHQLAIVLGLFLSQLVGFGLSGQATWRLLFSYGLLPLAIQSLLLARICPKSPQFLLSQGRFEEAKACLKRLRGHAASNEYEHWYQIIVNGIEVEVSSSKSRSQQESTASTSEIMIKREEEGRERGRDNGNAALTLYGLLFHVPEARKSLFVGLFLHWLQQFSGVNAVFYFSTSIFMHGDLNATKSAAFLTLLIGLVNIASTIISLWLMDKSGRRALTLWSTGTMSLCALLMVISMVKYDEWTSTIAQPLQVAGTFLYVFSFAVGLGPIPWLILCDIFPSFAVSPAGSLLVALNWTCNFIIGITFQALVNSLGSLTFLPFAVILFFGWIVIYYALPETKQRPAGFL